MCVCVCVLFHLICTFFSFSSFYVSAVTCPADTDGREAARKARKKENQINVEQRMLFMHDELMMLTRWEKKKKAAESVAPTRQII